MLSKSISTSIKVNAAAEYSQLLFTWMIPHTDDFGRLDGDPMVAKAIVRPLDPRPIKDFIAALIQMAELGLIDWYEADGKKVIEIVNADDHQSNLIGKRTKSRFPDRNAQSLGFRDFLGNSANYLSNLTKLNLTKPNLTQPAVPGASRKKPGGGFERFWKVYPLKVSKAKAEIAWRKLNPNEQLIGVILQAVERAKTSERWRKEGGKYIPYPATFLNQRRWEDKTEVDLGPTSGPSVGGRPDKFEHVYE